MGAEPLITQFAEKLPRSSSRWDFLPFSPERMGEGIAGGLEELVREQLDPGITMVRKLSFSARNWCCVENRCIATVTSFAGSCIC
jgi:hypothetical protein